MRPEPPGGEASAERSASLCLSPRASLERRLRLAGTLKAVRFALAPESAFKEFIRETEQEHLFRKLAYPENPSMRVIQFVPFHNTGCAILRDVEISSLKERYQPQVEAMLAQAPRIEEMIRRIGQEAFCAHFLRNDGPLDRACLARACGLGREEIERLIDWVNDFFIQSHFSQPSALAARTPYLKVATFEREGGGWSVRYYSPLMARGRYVIDRARLQALRLAGNIRCGAKSLRRLLRRLELINERKTTLDLVLQWFALRQKAYLDSGSPERLIPLQQRHLAREVGRNPSTICRALQGRSVLLPWGEEKTLRDLFVTRKDQLKRFWEQEPGLPGLSDETMRGVLMRRFGVRLSRRSVTAYRRELGLPSLRARR